MMPEDCKRIEVAAGLIRQGGKFLAAKRPDDAPFGGYWELPGGKLEKDEPPSEALKRELAEELAIKVAKCRYLAAATHYYPEQKLHVSLHFYEVSEFEGMPLAKEGQTLLWLAPEEIKGLTFLEADAEFLANFV